jgi:micrococcal nuclease
MLGHVFKGEQNINRQMVYEGLAVNYCIFPNERYCRDYARLTERNIAEKRGMYSDSSVELPYEWRRRVSGREDDKWVGDMFTHEVFRPGNLDEVPVGNRMFFLNENQIHDPYRKVE